MKNKINWTYIKYKTLPYFRNIIYIINIKYKNRVIFYILYCSNRLFYYNLNTYANEVNLFAIKTNLKKYEFNFHYYHPRSLILTSTEQKVIFLLLPYLNNFTLNLKMGDKIIYSIILNYVKQNEIEYLNV